MAQSSKIQFGYRRHPDQDRTGGRYRRTSGGGGRRRAGRAVARDRSGAARPAAWCCSTTPTGSARGRARSAFPSARWNSGTGSASASAWSTRAWCGASARSFTAPRSSISSICCRKQGHKRPAFINLQQFYAEAYLVDRVQELPAIDLRWRNKVTGLEQRNDHRGADDRDAGRALPAARRTMWSPATARGRRCGRWSARNSPARCSRISS